MKAKVLILCLIVGVGATICFCWMLASARHPVTIPEPVETGVPPSAASPDSLPAQTAILSQMAPARPRPLRIPADPPAASLLADIEQAMASTNAETQDFLLTNLLPALVFSDPMAAGRLAEANTNETSREFLLSAVARLWAAQDADAALAWAAGLPRSGEREVALNDVCLQWAEADPAQAVAMRESFLAENQPFDALEDITAKWAEKDLASALAWIGRHPHDKRRDPLIGRAAYVQAQTAPEEAARLVAEDMTPGEVQIEAAVSVLYQWGRRNLAAATAWAERFPEGPLRERALKELAGIAQHQSSEQSP